MVNAFGLVPPTLLESAVLGLFNEPDTEEINQQFINLVKLAPVTPVKNLGTTFKGITDTTWRGINFKKTPKAASEIALNSGELDPIEVSFGNTTGEFKRYPIGSFFLSDVDRQMYNNNAIAIADYVGALMASRAYAVLGYLVNSAITTTGNFTFAANPGALAASDSINTLIFQNLKNELTLNQKWAPGLPISCMMSNDLTPRFMANNDFAKAIGVGSDYKLGMADSDALQVWFARYLKGCTLQENLASYINADDAVTAYSSLKLSFVRSDAKNAFCRFFVPTTDVAGSLDQSAPANPGSMFKIWSARTDASGVQGEIFFGDMYFDLVVTNAGGGKLYHTFT